MEKLNEEMESFLEQAAGGSLLSRLPENELAALKNASDPEEVKCIPARNNIVFSGQELADALVGHHPCATYKGCGYNVCPSAAA